LGGLFGHSDGVTDLGPRRAGLLGLADVVIDELVTEVGQGLGTQSCFADAGQCVGAGEFLVEAGDQVGEADVDSRSSTCN
jgi:hypothetical protein